MEMTNSCQVAEEPGQSGSRGRGATGLKLLGPTSEAGRGIRMLFEGGPLREGPAQGPRVPIPNLQLAPALLATPSVWLEEEA